MTCIWHNFFGALIPESCTVPGINLEEEAQKRKNLLGDFYMCLAWERLIQVFNVTTGKGATNTTSAQLILL
jgi:hypothetical protein